MRNLAQIALLKSDYFKKRNFRVSNENGLDAERQTTPSGNVLRTERAECFFRVDERIGGGSSFAIYECTNAATDQRVTLKVLSDVNNAAAALFFEIEISRLLEHGADLGLCLSSRGQTQFGPYYAVNGDRDAALAFMLGQRQ